jgi:hypothetical protein
MTLSQPRGRRGATTPSANRGKGGTVRPVRNGGMVHDRPADAQASIARYTSLAIAAASSGDQVQAESYHQQAEYYRKVLHGTAD